MDFKLQSPLFLAGAIALILVEMVWLAVARRRGYDYASAAGSLGVFVGNVAAGVLGSAVIAPIYMACWSAAPVQLPADDWRVWAVGFLAFELAYYWEHRFGHTVRWMWANHAVHHSASSFVLPTALRLGWTNVIAGGWLFFTPLILIGFPPLVVVGLLAFNLHYQFLLHTELVGRLGPIEWVLNTPSHHRIHHASNAPYLDKNFGGVLIVFDRLFGTFANERPEEHVRYGLTTPITSNNPFDITFREWGRLAGDARRAASTGALLGALFGRPSGADDHRDVTASE